MAQEHKQIRLGWEIIQCHLNTLKNKRVAAISCLPKSRLGTNKSILNWCLQTKRAVSITVGNGESYKSLSCCKSLIRLFQNEGFRRGDIVLALGGGVIGDLAGFLASCYLRGISLIHLPTTLLSQTDSAIGGKTGLNTSFGKNTVGAFFFQTATLIDVTMLRGLPKREWHSGLCEIIKVGVCSDAPFFCWVESNLNGIIKRKAPTIINLVRRSAELKSSIVLKDSTEKGIRSVLNFGHTFGHAIELGLSFSRWSHGEAVSCGMMLATQTSLKLGMLVCCVRMRLFRLLSICNLPTTLPKDLRLDSLIKSMWFDKKNLGNSFSTILLRDVADPIIQNISPSQLSKMISF
ncbi:3-dehydroquinate synthase [Candidatus Tremblaya phenacola PAVE]|nr:3-dehydroquinate synthase [Candidatus Tremblaya phenacola PAVE]